MKKYWILVILILSFFSCNKPKEEPIFELIAYRWALKDNYLNNCSDKSKLADVSFVKCELYVQIYRNGDCVVSKERGLNQNELYSSFKIDTVVLNPVIRLFNDTKRDTTMIEETEPGSYIYDGPSIRFIENSKNKKKQTIKFNHTKFSNSNLVQLYNHINSKSESISSNDNLIQSKEERMKEIYEQEIMSINFPVIMPDTVILER